MDIKEIDGSKVTVIYHANCYDGFCAAWLFWQMLPNARFIAMQPNQAVEDIDDVVDRHVFVVDLSFNRETTLSMIEMAKTFVCLDHHKTAVERIGGLPGCVVCMNRSGAQMAWDYLIRQTWGFFEPENGRHWLVEYTADLDLWKWELPGSRYVNAALSIVDFDFDEWQAFANTSLAIIRMAGRPIAQYLEYKTSKVVKKAKLVCVEVVDRNGFRHLIAIPCVNEPNRDIRNDVAGQLAVKYRGIGMTYYHDGEQYRYSIRSTKKVDIRWIAEHFGGGGHKNAAGFSRKAPFELAPQQ